MAQADRAVFSSGGPIKTSAVQALLHNNTMISLGRRKKIIKTKIYFATTPPPLLEEKYNKLWMKNLQITATPKTSQRTFQMERADMDTLRGTLTHTQLSFSGPLSVATRMENCDPRSLESEPGLVQSCLVYQSETLRALGEGSLSPRQ